MTTNEVQDAQLLQLESQQALFTNILRSLLEGFWCGEPPSADAYLHALDPSLTVACQRPLLAGDEGIVTGDPWSEWDAPTIAACTASPQTSIEANWPAVYAQLVAHGIASREVQGGALGTMAVETAQTFEPVEEAFWMDEAWRYANLRYQPYWGRGYIQLTWDYNYQDYGDRLGLPLFDQPDLAMRAEHAAAIFAEFFDRSGAAGAAQVCDWTECRRLVQGADAGLDELLHVVHCLGLP
jgi:hypothetical protein